MGKKHFTEEQSAYALRQQEAGTPIAELTRKLGISEQTFYRWKRKFAGLGVAELRRLRRLKEMLAVYRLAFGQPRQEDLLPLSSRPARPTTILEHTAASASV